MKVGTDGVLLGAWADVDDVDSILDIGTGTGVIALMAAQRNVEAKVDGVELDESSARQAQDNFKQSPFKNRLQAYPISIQSYAEMTEKEYDIIISNPPFFQVGNTKEAIDERRRMGRQTSFLRFEDLLKSVDSLLSYYGSFQVILPAAEGQRFVKLAIMVPLHVRRMTMVKSIAHKPVERLLIEFSRIPGDPEMQELIIQNSGTRHDYTDEYVALVKDFYTIL
ncbi:UNVERIFIED_CONTAM: hypothetical protein GTU68_015763 [Idotea baltica]|nr:hypothetical protein [Idotea baltica]